MKPGTISKVLQYYFQDPDSRSDVLMAMREFFNQPNLVSGGKLETRPEEDALFSEWFFFDFKTQNGKTILENFYQDNPLSLSKEDIRIYKELQKNIYGLFETLKVRRNKGLKLRDLQEGKVYEVSERSASLSLRPGEVFAGRISKLAGIWKIVSADIQGCGITSDDTRDFLFGAKDKINPKKLNDIIKKKVILEDQLGQRINEQDSMPENVREVINKLENGSLSQEEIESLLAELEEQDMSGQIIGIEDPDDESSKQVVEYIEFHNNIKEKDYKNLSDQKIKDLAKKLDDKKTSFFDKKKAIMILGHSGKLAAFEALKEYSKVTEGEFRVWVETALNECEMFLKSDLLDRPMVEYKELRKKR